MIIYLALHGGALWFFLYCATGGFGKNKKN